MTEHEINQAVAEQIQLTRRFGDRSFREGERVGLLDGQVATVADSLVEIVERLRAIDPDPGRGMIVHAVAPKVDIIR